MQPSTTLSESGHMPLVYLGQRPGKTGISFSVVRGGWKPIPTWIRLHPDVGRRHARHLRAGAHSRSAVDARPPVAVRRAAARRRRDAGRRPGRRDDRRRSRACAAARPTTRPARRLAIKPAATPLETLVEREAVQETAVDNLRLRVESGLHLAAHAASGLLRGARDVLDRAVSVRRAGLVPCSTMRAREWLELVDGRVPDGAKARRGNQGTACAGQHSARSPTAEATVLRAWLSWAGTRFDTPAGGPSTWDPTHMEYGFSVAGLGADRRSAADRPEYVEGRLDWYDFEQATGTTGRHRSGDDRVDRSAFPRRSISRACRTRASGPSRIRRCDSTSSTCCRGLTPTRRRRR